MPKVDKLRSYLEGLKSNLGLLLPVLHYEIAEEKRAPPLTLQSLKDTIQAALQDATSQPRDLALELAQESSAARSTSTAVVLRNSCDGTPQDVVQDLAADIVFANRPSRPYLRSGSELNSFNASSGRPSPAHEGANMNVPQDDSIQGASHHSAEPWSTGAQTNRQQSLRTYHHPIGDQDYRYSPSRRPGLGSFSFTSAESISSRDTDPSQDIPTSWCQGDAEHRRLVPVLGQNSTETRYGGHQAPRGADQRHDAVEARTQYRKPPFIPQVAYNGFDDADCFVGQSGRIAERERRWDHESREENEVYGEVESRSSVSSFLDGTDNEIRRGEIPPSEIRGSKISPSEIRRSKIPRSKIWQNDETLESLEEPLNYTNAGARRYRVSPEVMSRSDLPTPQPTTQAHSEVPTRMARPHIDLKHNGGRRHYFKDDIASGTYPQPIPDPYSSEQRSDLPIQSPLRRTRSRELHPNLPNLDSPLTPQKKIDKPPEARSSNIQTGKHHNNTCTRRRELPRGKSNQVLTRFLLGGARKLLGL